MNSPRHVLIIETTCDETATAVVGEDRRVLGSVVVSQTPLHQRFGGIVPEIASRAHVERILPALDHVLHQAGLSLGEVGAVAVATTPGLAGSLLVGLAAAKALAVALDIPLVAYNHVEAHIYACRMAAGRDVFPCVGLVVSGGHTSLYRCQAPLELKLLGSTIDDAAGEAFDKVAILLGLEYPGGPSIERAARNGNRAAHRFPRPLLGSERLDFSFSGLKTAVRYRIAPPAEVPDASRLSAQDVGDLAASFQEAVVDVLVAKSIAAVAREGLARLCVGGGVAANGRLRERLSEETAAGGIELVIPPLELCTDNAVMGAIALERLAAGGVDELSIEAEPGLLRS